jgi:hypothetical protein
MSRSSRILAVALLLTALPAFAAGPVKNTRKAAPKPAPAAPVAESAPAVSQSTGPNSLELYVGPSFALLDGNSGFGVDIQVYFKNLVATLPALDIGFETGLAHYSLTGGSMNVIPILPAAIYHLDFGTSFRTYGGVAIGLAYYSSSRDVPSGFATTTSTSASGMKFEMLFKPGALFEIKPGMDLYVEPKFGFYDGLFTWLPTVGVVLGL